MKITWALAVVSALAVFGFRTVSADEVNVSDSTQNVSYRIDALEAELASLRETLGDDKDGGKDDCDGKGDCDCVTRTWYAGMDAVIVRPQLGALSVGGVQLTPDFDYKVSPRFWAGVTNSNGLGARVTYWTFDANESLPAAGTFADVEVDSLDLDTTVNASICNTDLTFFGGIKYGKIRTELNADLGIIDANLAHQFEGFGPTLGMEVRRQIRQSNFALVGMLRGSWLFGQTDLEIQDLVAVNAEDSMTQVWEARLGVEYTRCVGDRGATLIARAVWEAQAWEIAPVATLISQDIGFQGPAFSLGLAY